MVGESKGKHKINFSFGSFYFVSSLEFDLQGRPGKLFRRADASKKLFIFIIVFAIFAAAAAGRKNLKKIAKRTNDALKKFA